MPRMAPTTVACTNFAIISNLLVAIGFALHTPARGGRSRTLTGAGMGAAPRHVSANSQLRGGRKGGPTARACNAAVIGKDTAAKLVTGRARCENGAVQRLKPRHMNAQSGAHLSEGLPSSGQQS